MPAKPLSTVQELVELTLFHAIRKVVVDNGYCPDIMSYTNDETGSRAYWAAFEAITTARGFSVEVFNNSNPDRKGSKKLPRIIMISESYLPGEIGGDQSRFYKPIGKDQFRVMQRPPQVVDFSFSIHLVCENGLQYRTCLGILGNAIPTRGYIPIYQPFENYEPCNLFIQNISGVPIPSYTDSLLEYVYRYVVKDVWLEEYAVDLGVVKALNEINLRIIQNEEVLETLDIT